MTALTRQVQPAVLPLRYRLLAFAVAYSAMIAGAYHWSARDLQPDLQRVAATSYSSLLVGESLRDPYSVYSTTLSATPQPVCNTYAEPLALVTACGEVELAPSECVDSRLVCPSAEH